MGKRLLSKAVSAELKSPTGEAAAANVVSGGQLDTKLQSTSCTVQLNAFVSIRDLQSDTVQKIRLVLPDQVDLRKKWISVFAPLSVALLGRRAGEIVTFNANGAERKVKVLEIESHSHA